ncbi:MAG: class I SAM-dependent methyltransferase [Candidatus Paceibacterota bacterium]|jgi:ubiquinone/menaquinone biosynthesis C-methylase UbiE
MFTDPLKNLKALGLRENNVVADLGAGTGFYSILASHLVPMGKVYAIEIQKDLIETIKNKVKHAHLKNVEVLWGNIEKIGGTKLGDEVVDAVILSNVFFQVENKDDTLKEAKRILKKGGEVLFIDWSDNSTLVSQQKIHITSKEKVREMFDKHGFIFVRDIDAGEHHYGMILKKNEK